MKHPALTRALAAALAVLCLVTLIAGGGALWKAWGIHKEDLRQQELLRERTDRAAELSARLDAELEDYEKASSGLEERLAEHDKESMDYRGRLATLTATRAGIKMGRAALEQSSGVLWRAKRQFEDGYAEFQKGAAMFSQIYQIYQSVSAAIQRIRGLYSQGLAYLEEGMDDEFTALLTPAQVLASVQAVRLSVAALEELIRSSEGQMGTEDAAESLQRLHRILNGLNNQMLVVDPSALAHRAVEQTLAQADSLIASRAEEGVGEAEAMAEADAACQATLGMNYGEAKDWLTQNADAVGDAQNLLGSLAELDPEETAALLSEFGGDGVLLQQALAVLAEEEESLAAQEEALSADPEAMSSPEAMMALLNTVTGSCEKILGLVSSLIEGGKQQLDAIGAQLDAAGKAIEDGIAVIARQRLKMSQMEDDLERQREEMAQEKELLLKKGAELKLQQQTVDMYEEMTKEFRAARAALMSNHEIADRVNGGEDLLESAELVLAEMKERQREDFIWRQVIAVLMIAAAVMGAFGVAGGFEKLKWKRLWLPCALTILLSALGEGASLYRGYGLWYSALFLLLAAAALLPLRTGKKA